MALERTLAFAGHQIRRCHQIAVALFAQEATGFDITPVQYAVLTAIGEMPDADATRLAAVVALDRSTTGNVLERLENRGLLAREHRAHDKRTKRLHLTAAGRQLLDEIAPAIARSQARFVDVLSKEEQRRLHDLLDKLIRVHEGEQERLEA